MKLIGPKSIASKLHLAFTIVLIFAIMRVLFMALAPILPHGSRQYLSFDVQSGPLMVSFDMLRGAEAKWSIWAMELVSRTCHAAVIYFLVRILEPAGAGEPFHPRLPNRLRMIAGVFVIGSLLRTIFCAVLMNLGWRPEQGVWVSWAIDFDAIFMGIVLLVLAEIFRRGYALRTENELTV